MEFSERSSSYHFLLLHAVVRANLTRIAITAQAACLFNSATMFCRMQTAESPMKDLYRGALFVSLTLLLLSSVWMASNHRWKEDMARRRRNTRIELGYCCVQLAAGFLTARFGLGLAGGGGGAGDRGGLRLCALCRPPVYGPQTHEVRRR